MSSAGRHMSLASASLDFMSALTSTDSDDDAPVPVRSRDKKDSARHSASARAVSYPSGIETEMNDRKVLNTPMTTRDQAQLIAIRLTWKTAKETKGDEKFPMNALAELLYNKFFEISAETVNTELGRSLQSRSKIMARVIQALLTIDTLDKEAAHELARDMYTLGFTRRSVFLAYGQALLHMMKSRLGAGYNNNVRGAWAHWYGVLTEHLMKTVGMSITKGAMEEMLAHDCGEHAHRKLSVT